MLSTTVRRTPRNGIWSRAAGWMRDALEALPSEYDDFDRGVFRAMPPF